MEPHASPLSVQIRRAFDREAGEITFGEFLERIEARSFGFLLVLLSLPSALPLPAPGYSVPFGIVLSLLAVQMIRRRSQPWFPERVLQRKIKSGGDSKVVKGMTRFIAFFERMLKPRGAILFRSGVFPSVLGGVILLCSMSMILPIPLTNTLPALGIFLMGLAVLEEDLAFGLVGMVIGLLGLALTTAILVAIAMFGAEGVDMVKNWIKPGAD